MAGNGTVAVQLCQTDQLIVRQVALEQQRQDGLAFHNLNLKLSTHAIEYRLNTEKDI